MFKNDYKYDLSNIFNLSIVYDYILNYKILLRNESDNYKNNLIYLIKSNKFDNLIITIYPLDIEEFAYYHLFNQNNLGFVNFTKAFPTFIEYEINKKNIILVILMESLTNNSTINNFNYYLYEFNEKRDNEYLSYTINLEENNLIEILYPLNNYYKNNSNIITEINKIYYIYHEFEISNISEHFYNDICFIYTSNEKTDITLNDRRKNYYLNSTSLCGNNCFYIKLINKGLNNLRIL